MIPHLALTSGEPAGIGPDLCVRLAKKELPCALTVVGDPQLMEDRAKQLGLSLNIHKIDIAQGAIQHRRDHLNVWPVELSSPSVPGHLNSQNSDYVLRTITQATESCIAGWTQAIVTAPIHKGIINDAGIPFTGHTEYIADITGGEPVMLLAAPGLRVALATTHIPLAKVSASITQESLSQKLRILHQDLSLRFGLKNPRILVTGLNPHAGEGGHLGTEEQLIIEPCIKRLQSEGMNLIGPLPADTLFTPRVLEHADAVMAMYHDQGLPVLKYVGFGQAVNITLGLHIIRTSVDHGTALELAGTLNADMGSLEAAIKTAVEMCLHSSEPSTPRNTEH